jgi:hypothetical protein
MDEFYKTDHIPASTLPRMAVTEKIAKYEPDAVDCRNITATSLFRMLGDA